MNKRIMSVLLTSLLLSLIAVAAIGTATANEIYFDPQAGSAAYDGSTTVDLMVNADNFRSGEVEFTYVAGCIDVTDFDENFVDFTNVGWNTGTDGRERITFAASAEMTGVYRIGTLTIECNGGACNTDLLFDGAKCILFDSTQEIGATWTDGTFTCGEGPTDNDVYFDPQVGSAACAGSTTVDLMVNADNFRSGEVEFTYVAGCIDVTDFDENFVDFTNVGWNTGTDGRERITFAASAEMTGVYRIGTLTIECNGGACNTDLLFDGAKCILFDSTQEISATWTDGTFTCSSQSTYYADVDNDGYGDPNDSVVAESAPSGYVSDNTDCDDTNAAVNPGATEIWNDGIDNDCDGYTDCDDSDCLVDADGDGYNAVPCGDDCDDTNAAVNPGATEVQNGIDDNCNGQIDEGFCECDFCMPLEAGLNLVSVPRCVEVGGSSMALAVFNLSGIETCDSWDGCTGEWSDDLPNAMQVVPARAYFVYKVNAETICMNGTTYMDTQTLCIDTWAMVGFPSLDPMTVTEFRAASNLNDKFLTAWQWNGGWYPMTGNSNMEPYHGYVLWMTDNGVMPGMIAE